MRVRLTASQADDLAVLCSLSDTGIASLIGGIESQGPTIRQTVLKDIIIKTVGVDKADAVARVIFGLSALAARDHTKVASVVNGVTDGLNDGFPNDGRFVNWPLCAPKIKQLLSTSTVFLTAKAMDISYDFERFITDSRILTSIRPVFNEDKSDIVGSAIVQTLRIEYISSDGDSSSQSFALDLDDLYTLRKACDDGIKKAKLAKDTVVEKWRIEAVMFGERVS